MCKKGLDRRFRQNQGHEIVKALLDFSEIQQDLKAIDFRLKINWPLVTFYLSSTFINLDVYEGCNHKYVCELSESRLFSMHITLESCDIHETVAQSNCNLEERQYKNDSR